MEKQKLSVIETIVTAVITLVVVQTFLEDFSVLMNWSFSALQVLIITGFCFDLFFTIEFLVRLYNSKYEKGAAHYFVHSQGWVDFCASIPLLLLVSGHQMISLISTETGIMTGFSFAGFLSMLKLIKTIRIARILRLLRLIKVFKSIKYADSPMAQRHIRKIVTIGVSALVISLLGFTVIFETFSFSKAQSLYEEQRNEMVSTLIQSKESGTLKKMISGLSQLDMAHRVLIVKVDGKTLYTRFNQDVYDTSYTEADYEYRTSGTLEVFFDVKEENNTLARIQARDSLIFFFIVIALILSYLFIYSPHFALTISDPVYVMKRGMEEKNYNLEVKIPELYKDDDLFHLAGLYNEGYLPLKDRLMSSEEHTVLDMGLSEITDLIEE